MYIDDFAEQINTNKPKYERISIPKKNGGRRKIFIPDKLTAAIQRAILYDLYEMDFQISEHATAFIKNISIVDNARAHLGNKVLICYDLRDFFDNITYKKIEVELKKANVPPNLLKAIKNWCFSEKHLPQGAPTSPFFSNLVCANLDFRFSTLAKKIDAVYTRYADDIIISGSEDILRYQTIFKRIIRTEKFFINYQKIRVSTLDAAPFHVVTGLIVNEKVSVRPKYVEKVWIELKKKIPFTSKRHGIKFENVIRGKINFIKFVDSGTGQPILNYAYKHDILN